MTHRRIRASLLAVSTAVLGVTTGTAPPTALAEPAPGTQSLDVSGDMAIAPGIHLLHIYAVGDRTAAGVTGGSYDATVLDGRNPTPVHFRGPITCLYTNGNTASLLYPITSTAPDLLPTGLRGATAVQVTVRKGLSAPNQVGLTGPLPTTWFHGCDPGATPFEFDGSVAISQR